MERKSDKQQETTFSFEAYIWQCCRCQWSFNF